jgi:preprotein translocase subunit SecY
MISAFTNTFKIPELRNRIIFTLLILVVVRLGAAIACPGIDVSILHEWFTHEAQTQAGGNSFAALFNLFSGGAMENCAIFSLGVMPYISASIMMQLLTAVIPKLAKLAKEDGGRQKIMQYTRYATIALCLGQGYALAMTYQNSPNTFLSGIPETIARVGRPLVVNPGFGFILPTVIVLMAGTMFMMWMGDQITDHGVGNGMSLIITIGIVARLPAGLIQVWNLFIPTAENAHQSVQPMALVLLIAFFFIVVAAVICITQGQRKVVVQYAKRVVGRRQMGGGTQYMPLKVNYAGVMPIIFGQALLMFPPQIAQIPALKNIPWVQAFASSLIDGWFHYTIYGVMIFFFSYFWVATQFQPQQIADDLKKYGGYIPGVRPGKPTADYLNFAMNRLTFAGAVFLTVIAVLPQLLTRAMGIPYTASSFFGGTSLLIMVGVVLDTMRQIETHLIQRHYDGFLRKGRIRGRFEAHASGFGEAVQQGGLVWIYAVVAGLILIAAVFFMARGYRW